MDKLEARVQQAIADRVFPGCVIGVLQDGKKEIRPFGSTIYETENSSIYGTIENVTERTVYDLASITKSIPLAILTALFVAEGKLALTDQVKTFVPELQNDFNATIEDLLRYRVQGVRMSSLRFETFEEIRAHALERGFNAPPGESVYTNLPAFILGIVIERVGGASLAALAEERFFAPWGMSATTFFPAQNLCAPTEIEEAATIQGIPHDESARVFARARRTVGHAGLFSTAADLLTFASALMEKRLTMSFLSVAEAAETGLGWQVNDSNFMGKHAHPKMFGKTGFTGTSIVVDVAAKQALVILSNRTYPQRARDDSAIYAFRRDIADFVLGKG